MAKAMTLIASQVLGSATTTVTFSSIPSIYKDLRFIVSGTASSGVFNALNARMNSDVGTNYSYISMTGNGSTSSSSSSAATTSLTIGAIGNSQSDSVFDILDYSTTDKHKTTIGRSNQAGSATQAIAGRWASTSAITSIDLTVSGSTWTAGTTLTLYGIAG